MAYHEHGFIDAFYKIGELLGIGARTESPEVVFETVMLPKLRALKELEAENAALRAQLVAAKNEGYREGWDKCEASFTITRGTQIEASGAQPQAADDRGLRRIEDQRIRFGPEPEPEKLSDWDRAINQLEQGKCAKAPEGWQCTRGAGHEGPCAARDDRGAQGVAERRKALGRDWDLRRNLDTVTEQVKSLGDTAWAADAELSKQIEALTKRVDDQEGDILELLARVGELDHKRTGSAG